MEEKEKEELEDVPFIVYESIVDKHEKKERRSFIVIIVLLVTLLLSNFAWLYMWNQYEYIDGYTEDITVDSEGGNAIYQEGEGNEVNNGEGTR